MFKEKKVCGGSGIQNVMHFQKKILVVISPSLNENPALCPPPPVWEGDPAACTPKVYFESETI